MAEDVGVEPILLLTPTVRRGIASHARPLKIYISSRKFVASQAKSSSSRTARSTHLFSSCLLLVPVFTIRSAASCSDIRGHKTALNKVASFCKRLSVAVGKLVAQVLTESKQQLQGHVESLEAIGREGVAICVERSSKRAQAQVAASEDVPQVDDLWLPAVVHANKRRVDCLGSLRPRKTLPFHKRQCGRGARKGPSNVRFDDATLASTDDFLFTRLSWCRARAWTRRLLSTVIHSAC